MAPGRRESCYIPGSVSDRKPPPVFTPPPVRPTGTQTSSGAVGAVPTVAKKKTLQMSHLGGPPKALEANQPAPRPAGPPPKPPASFTPPSAKPQSPTATPSKESNSAPPTAAPSRLIDRLRSELGEWNASDPSDDPAPASRDALGGIGIGIPDDDDDDGVVAPQKPAAASAPPSSTRSATSAAAAELGAGMGVPMGVSDDDSVRWPIDPPSPSSVKADQSERARAELAVDAAAQRDAELADGDRARGSPSRVDPLGVRPPSSPVRTGATLEMEALDAATLAKLDAERREMRERALAGGSPPPSGVATGAHDSLSIALEDADDGDGDGFAPEPTVTVAGVQRPRMQVGGAAALSPDDVARALEHEKRQLELEEQEERRKQEARARAAAGARESAAARKRAESVHAAVPAQAAARRGGAGRVLGITVAVLGLAALGVIGAAALGIGGLDKIAADLMGGASDPAGGVAANASPGSKGQETGSTESGKPIVDEPPPVDRGDKAVPTADAPLATATAGGTASGDPPTQPDAEGSGGADTPATDSAGSGDVVLAGTDLKPEGSGGTAGVPEAAQPDSPTPTTPGGEGSGTTTPSTGNPEVAGGSGTPIPAKQPVVPVTGDDVDELLASAREALATNPAQSLALATRAYELEQRNRVMVVLALANCHLGDGPAARGWFRQLQVADMRREATNVCIGLEIEILAKDAGPTPRELVRAGEAELAAGKLDAALGLAKQSLDAKRTMGAQVLAAKVHCSKGDSASAKAIVQRLPSKHRAPVKTHCEAVGHPL